MVVEKLKVWTCVYQAFWMLVIDQVIEEGIVPVIVMFSRDEVDWKQENVTPEVPLEQENPETRLTKDGRVRRMRLPDA